MRNLAFKGSSKFRMVMLAKTLSAINAYIVSIDCGIFQPSFARKHAPLRIVASRALIGRAHHDGRRRLRTILHREQALASERQRAAVGGMIDDLAYRAVGHHNIDVARAIVGAKDEGRRHKQGGREKGAVAYRLADRIGPDIGRADADPLRRRAEADADVFFGKS